MPHWKWVLARVTRRLWFRATLIGTLGVLAAMLATVVDRYIPGELPGTIGADAVESVLEIIASSMLAVTTFSLSVMTSAYGSATSNVTPRATRLLIEDRVSQNVLSTFVGSFLFGIVGIVVLKTGAYGDRGRFVLFVVTVGVIFLIVVTLLRWIDHLTHFGRVEETTDRVEAATRKAMERRLEQPFLGGRRLRDDVRAGPRGEPVLLDEIGYIQHVDMPALARCCEAADVELRIPVLPGTFVHAGTVVAEIVAAAGSREAVPRPDRDAGDADEREDLRRAVRAAFTVGKVRSFDQDPRFGLAVLSEIGSRALSPAVNDPGTAIDVIGRMSRLLTLWARGADEGADREISFPRLHIRALDAQDLLEDAFLTMARDGAGQIEVQLRLRKTLDALMGIGDAAWRAAVRHQADVALARAEAALTLEADRSRLRQLVGPSGTATGGRASSPP